MKSLDEIKASVDTVMTETHIRLFALADCDPTECHACKKQLHVGDTFRLIPHQVGNDEMRDEMCCATCGQAELLRRDKLDKRNRTAWRRKKIAAGGGGYSRPSSRAKRGALLKKEEW